MTITPLGPTDVADAASLNNLFNQLQALVAPDLPITTGQQSYYAGSSAPSGWLLCDGTAVSRATYATLFALVGTTYGAGDGSTTFNLPDMKGRMLLGSGQGSGLTNRSVNDKAGAETVVLASNNLPSHTHSVGTPTISGAAAGPGIIGVKVNNVGGSPVDVQTGGAGWSGTAHQNMQPSLVLNVMIKT